jgi:integrase
MLLTFFSRNGKGKRLDEITDADVAALVAWRRAQTVHGRKGAPVIGPATVNRTTLVPLKAVFTRAKKTWRQQLPLEPNWHTHRLPQPEERVRELDTPEAEALDAAVREDYALWFEFARITGLRRNETLIKWTDVNWFAKRITTIGKRGRKVSTPITPAVAAILEQCKGHHPTHVFTYICCHPGEGRVRGERYPITPDGAKTQWRRLRAKAGVQDFRFHDIRHDVASKLLRATGNMKLVQRALNHANIATTAKYAHVLDGEVAAALEGVAESQKKSQKDHSDAA